MKDSDFKGAANYFVESKSIGLEPNCSANSSDVPKLNDLASTCSNGSSTSLSKLHDLEPNCSANSSAVPKLNDLASTCSNGSSTPLSKLHDLEPNCSSSSSKQKAAIKTKVLEQTCAINSSSNDLHPASSNYTIAEAKWINPKQIGSDQFVKFAKLKLETPSNFNHFDSQRKIHPLDPLSSDFVAIGNPPSYNDVVPSSIQSSKKPINDSMTTRPNNCPVSAQPQRNIPKPDTVQRFHCGPYEGSTGLSSAFRCHGNAIYQSTIIADNGFEDSACPAYCGTCKITVLTSTTINYKPSAYLCCFIMFFSGICCPLSYVPFLFCGPRKVFHACPQCNNVLGIYIDK